MRGAESVLRGIPDHSSLGDLQNMSPEKRDEAILKFLTNLSPEQRDKAGEFYSGLFHKLTNSPMAQKFLNDDGAIEEFRKRLLEKPELESLEVKMKVKMKVSTNSKAWIARKCRMSPISCS